MTSQLVWLITGTSSGIGRELTLAALKRGDKVIATARARSFNQLGDLKEQGADVLELDVTAPLESLHETAKKAVGIHGRVDVVVNNAGYIEVGAIEENTPEETYNVFNTNVFGGLNVARAFLPYMRERKSGTIFWLGSIGGWRGSVNGGIYSATKYATRSLSESLHAEISPLGLRSIVIELGYFRTSLLSSNNLPQPKYRIDAYKDVTTLATSRLNGFNGKQPGDPKAAAEVMVDFAKGEGVAAGKTVPPVMALGSDCVDAVKGACSTTMKRVEEWEAVSRSTDLPK